MSTEIVPMFGPGGLFIEQATPPSSQQWILDGNQITIGRDASSGIFLDTVGVSRHHANLVRRGASWSIVDARSTNGTYVNGSRGEQVVLQPRDRIRLGQAELVVRDLGASGTAPARRPASQVAPISYHVPAQYGNNNNVAGNQLNNYSESSLRYIASRRGRARLLIVWGIVLTVGGAGLGLFDVLRFDESITKLMNSSWGSTDPSNFPTSSPIPAQFIPIFGLAAFMELIGITMFVFGLIVRGGAKREARLNGVQWT